MAYREYRPSKKKQRKAQSNETDSREAPYLEVMPPRKVRKATESTNLKKADVRSMNQKMIKSGSILPKSAASKGSSNSSESQAMPANYKAPKLFVDPTYMRISSRPGTEKSCLMKKTKKLCKVKRRVRDQNEYDDPDEQMRERKQSKKISGKLRRKRRSGSPDQTQAGHRRNSPNSPGSPRSGSPRGSEDGSQPAPEPEAEPENWWSWWKNRKWLIVVIVIAAILIIGVSVGVALYLSLGHGKNNGVSKSTANSFTTIIAKP